MDLTVHHRFAADMPRVLAALADEAVARARAEASGASEVDVVVDTADDGTVTVSSRRVLPTERLDPGVRPFVGSSLSVRYSEAWAPPSADAASGTFAVEVAGVPGRASGTLELRADGEGTSLAVQGDVLVTIPLLGGAVTTVLAQALEKGLQDELGAVESHLAQA
jgi:hypothetical protein